ncbi:hypothetical protein Bbelb_247640 [Branchiostoma belcheri]|nr:hypothetical protein Bbelb_247640 [Branchiostoma belcheri]
MVFRKGSDKGKTRKQATPDSHQMLENLERFYERWHETRHNDKAVLSDQSKRALKNVKFHIGQGCLSDIPPGIGTNRNERLHATLNAHGILRAKTVGVPLALAAIQNCFHAVNTKKCEKHSDFIPPFVAQKMEDSDGIENMQKGTMT